VNDAAPFSTRLAHNSRAAIGLLAVLWIAGGAGILVRGDPLIDVMLAGLAIFVFIGPAGVLTYSALSIWRTRGILGHYAVWVATLIGAWLPLFLLAQVVPVASSDFHLFDRPVLFFVATILAGLVWGSISRSIQRAREQAQRAMDDKRSV